MSSVDGSRSRQGTSDEFHTNICGPCKTTDDVERGASHFCNDCSDYLCDQCKDYHRKIPLLKNHVILSGSQVPSVTSTCGRPATVIYCSCNKNQEVQHYCDDHHDILCDDCRHTKHYKCKVTRLLDKTASYTQSKLDTIISQIETLKIDYENLEKSRNEESKRLGRSKEDCQKEIEAFRREIDMFLSDLENDMLKLLESREQEGQSRISQHIATLTATIKMLESDYKLLEDAKNDGRKAVMFAADARVSKGVQDYEERLSDIDNDAIDTDITFERNKSLLNLLFEIDSIGCLHKESARNLQSKELLDSKIQSQKQVTVKMSDERSSPLITGSAVMQSGEIVLCDSINDRLKLLDTSDALKDNLKLSTSPWDISVVDEKSAIITLPWKQQIQYIDVIPQLTLGRVLQMSKPCWGIHVTGGKIFTSCHENALDGEVVITDLDGNLLQQLGMNQDGTYLFQSPYYITVSQSKQRVFVSDDDDESVTCMTMDNQVVYQYSDQLLRCPLGLYCDSGENILVCGRKSNNVQVITAEGKKRCCLISSNDGLDSPRSISYRQSDDTMIVGCGSVARAGPSQVLMLKLGS